MGQSMRAGSRRGKRMAKAVSSMQMVTRMRANGRLIRLMDKVSTLTMKGLGMRVHFSTISSMALALKSGLMESNTLATITWA
jgi:hypothetical protein